jgi:hypothetical protein
MKQDKKKHRWNLDKKMVISHTLDLNFIVYINRDHELIRKFKKMILSPMILRWIYQKKKVVYRNRGILLSKIKRL